MDVAVIDDDDDDDYDAFEKAIDTPILLFLIFRAKSNEFNCI